MLIESDPCATPMPSAAGESGVQSAQGRAVRVLVVDDNPDAADLLGEALCALGYEVRVVYEGLSALALAPSFRPDLAILDIGLPGMSGFDLAVRLRALQGLEGIKCVAITGYGQADDRRRSLESGFHAHLLKPIDVLSLERELRRIMG
jgi:CheY-like chemotaxis protein